MWKRAMLFGFVTLATLAACDRAPEPESAETVAVREEAKRSACIGALIASQAGENLAMLDLFLPPEEGGAEFAADNGVALAAHRFAQAYDRHAELRALAFAYRDSAVNHARTRADSVRFIQKAEGIRVRTPEPGSLQDNVAAAYARDFAAVRTDEDHPCNWDI